MNLSRLTAQNIRTFNLTQAQFGVVECLGHLGPMLIGELTKKHLVSGGDIMWLLITLKRKAL